MSPHPLELLCVRRFREGVALVWCLIRQVCNIIMTSLQWYWASLILLGMYRKVAGGEAPDAHEGETEKSK